MNVIIIKTDQQRYDTLGCMGHPLVRTPHLDRLAARGTVFENAFCSSPLCVPSRVGFFTGQYTHRTGCTGNGPEHHLQGEDWSFLNELKSAGYVLGLAGKNHAFHDDYLAKYFSFREEYQNWGKTHGQISAADRAVTAWLSDVDGPGMRLANGKLMEGLVEVALPFAETACPTWRIAEDAMHFVAENEHRPFFLHCSFPDPHFPNTVCEPYYSMYSPEDVELEAAEMDWSGHPFAHYVQSQSSGFDTYTIEERKRILAIYLGQVTFIDNAIGALLDDLEQRGLMEKTLIVFTSDHGDFAGRYGLIGKTKAFYEALIRIPLIMAIPGQPHGQRTSANCSNIDVLPTLAEGLGMQSSAQVQGESFLPVIAGRKKTHRDVIFAEVGSPEAPPPPVPTAEYGDYNRQRVASDGVFWFCEYTTRGRAAMIRQDPWKYCFYTGDKEELYNLATDPFELHNLADDNRYAAKKEQMKSALLAWALTEPVSATRVTPE
jgi:arylsulfatase A-like enzyme